MRAPELRLPHLWRTTAFRLTSLYGAILVLGLAALLALIYVQTATLMSKRVDQAIEAGIIRLRQADAESLPNRIRQAVFDDVRQMNYYGLFSAEGVWITGNIERWPQGVQVDKPAVDVDRGHDGPDVRMRAVRLPWGEQLVVGRDISQLAGVRGILLQAMLISGSLILVLGLSAGVILSVPSLRRVAEIQRASRRITHGDMAVRLPVSDRRDELDMLAGTVNAMVDEIERLLADAKNVGDTLAHDLRTPLTRLRALLYRTHEETPVDDARRAMIEQALSQTDILLARFQALLRIAEIERQARRAGFQMVDLAKLLTEIAELYEPLAEEAGLALRLALPKTVSAKIEADPELLFEAISNLVDNAIKFTPAGGVVQLGLCAGPAVEVVDSGAGIPEAERELALNRFHRGANAADKPGSGLGLAIVAAISRLHGFNLELADAAPGLRVTLRPMEPGPDEHGFIFETEPFHSGAA
jgi:signal transduction histidine kinase